jgi:hypothetical protein
MSIREPIDLTGYDTSKAPKQKGTPLSAAAVREILAKEVPRNRTMSGQFRSVEKQARPRDVDLVVGFQGAAYWAATTFALELNLPRTSGRSLPPA